MDTHRAYSMRRDFAAAPEGGDRHEAWRSAAVAGRNVVIL